MVPILEINNVSQQFRVGFWMRKVQVLQNIEFSIPEQSIFGFLGSNGAGKTTLIHLIAGLRTPSQGKIKVFGHCAQSLEARSKIGFLPERPYFHEHLTGESLLKYFGTLSGMSGVEIRKRIPVVLATVGLTQARKVELKRFSKGMLQRIGIAQALLHDPQFLLLDEPMSGLDPVGRKEIRELILQLSQQGKTIFFSSHVIPDIEAICDQIALIQNGKLIGYGPIGQFMTSGSGHSEIAWKGCAKEEASQWSELAEIQEIHDGFRGIALNEESVNRVLEKLLKCRAKILWVSPKKNSLENFFGLTQSDAL